MNFMQMRCPYCLAVTTPLGPLLVGLSLHKAIIAHSLVLFPVHRLNSYLCQFISIHIVSLGLFMSYYII